MLKKHSFLYFIGRGVPGVINLLALSLYTRLIPPDQYGTYSLVIVTVAMMNTVLFQWLRVSLVRFLPNHIGIEKQRLKAAIGVGFLVSSSLSIGTFCVYLYFFNSNNFAPGLLIIALLLLLLEAMFELSLEFFRSNLNVRLYTVAFIMKALIAITIGGFLAWNNMGALGLLIALVISDAIIIILFCKSILVGLTSSIKSFRKEHYRKLLFYGLPLTASFSLAFIINSSDRYIINYFLGEIETGYYSVGYDISRRSLWVVMQCINLASYPLVIKKLEKFGKSEANIQLEANFILLVFVSLPIAVSMSALSDRVASLFVGDLYVNAVSSIIPIITISALISGVNDYYLVQSFQLGHKTYLQIWPVAISAFVNVALNFFLIPLFGLMGAAYATLISYLIATVFNYIFSKKSYLLPIPGVKILKLVASAGFMVIPLYFLKVHIQGLVGSILIVVISTVVYLFAVFCFKVFPQFQLKKN